MVGVVAVGFALTGNRSPGFLAIEVWLVVALIAAGRERFGPRGVGVLALVGAAFVLGAGLFGAFHPGVERERVRAPNSACPAT